MTLSKIESTLFNLLSKHGIESVLKYLESYNDSLKEDDYSYLDKIINVFEVEFNLKKRHIISPIKNTGAVTDARRIFVYVLSENTNFNSKSICHIMSCSERTFWSYKKEVKERLISSPKFYKEFKKTYYKIKESMQNNT